jgi:serine/threonine protein kinase/predicted ATPase
VTPENWSLVGRIYQAALERSLVERTPFLANASAGNESLRREVESLLAAEQEAGDFLEADAATDMAEPSTVQSSSLVGKTLRQYEILSLLATGGMGEVYRALDTRLNREVAIKILPAVFASDLDRLRRFEQEAHAASRLNHPNIVTIYETGEAEDGRFLAMELVHGETLRRLMEARPPLHDVLRISLQVAQALKVAHASNIVHRDVKPENLMLRPDGYVKVLDFGLARLLPPSAGPRPAVPDCEPEGESPEAITEPGMVLGTVRYMSPEQARQKQVTVASDIFSFGLVVYELATGQHPFRAETEFGTLDAILSQAAPAPSKINPAIPVALEQIILRMLDKRAEARPSAADVELCLADIVATSKLASSEASSRNPKRTVGRTREHEQLNAVWDSAAAAHGLLCCVSGEPGIGKTTVVEDFLAGLAASGRLCMVARGRCAERLAGTEAYSPFIEALDGLQRGAASVAETMKRLAPTWHSQMTTDLSSGVLRELPRVERAYSQERVKRELGSFLRELSRRQTLVLFLEDLHWADLSTVDLLAFLADRISRLRLLVVITYRQSDLLLAKHPFVKLKQDLQARGIAHEIKLGLLSREEVGQYIDLEFPQHRLPPAVAEMIHAKTEGSPLFMTDLLRYFRERRIIAQDSGHWVLARPLPDIERDLPQSTRAMIERMIGQLDERDRPLLVAASVQGHDFDSAVIARALGRADTNVEERLQALERVHQFVGLVEELELPTKTIALRYRFTHVLYENALYATLQPARRAALSNAVAEAILTLYGDQSTAVASDLARLFDVGRKFMKAAEYYLIAARNANRIFAANEAAALARRGLSVIRSAPQTIARNEIEFSLHLVLGNALLVTLGYSAPEVKDLYEYAYGLCSTVGQPAQLLPILYGLWVSHLIRCEIEPTLGFGKDFLDLAKRVGSPAVLIGERMVGCPLFFLGELTQARPYFERAIALYELTQHRALAWLYGQEPGMTAHSYLAWILWLLGYPDQAATHNREALKIAREVEHALSRGHGLFFAAVHAHLSQDWEVLRELAKELVDFGQERNVTFWLPAGRVLSGLMHTKHGEGSAGIEEMRGGIEALVAAGNNLCFPILYRFLAEGYAHLLRPQEALAVLQTALTLIAGTRERCFEAEIHRFQGEVLLQQSAAGAETEAEGCFERAAGVARQQSAKSWELRACTSLGRLWARQGKRREAFELLAPLCHWFTEGGNTPDVKEARRLLEQLR